MRKQCLSWRAEVLTADRQKAEREEKVFPILSMEKLGYGVLLIPDCWGFVWVFFDLSFGVFFKTAMLWDCTEKLFDPQCHFESKLMSWQFSTKACPTSQTACFCCFWDELDSHRREPSPLFSKDFPAKQSNCVSQAQSSEGTEACWIQKSNLFPQAVYVLY